MWVGSGLGCGLILSGRLYEGADGAACELGHTIVVPNGIACSCGSHGCLEMYCSGKGLSLLVDDLFKPHELYDLGTRFGGAQLLIQQAYSGHERARQALDTAFPTRGLPCPTSSICSTPADHPRRRHRRCLAEWRGRGPPGGDERGAAAHAPAPTPEVSQLQNLAGVVGRRRPGGLCRAPLSSARFGRAPANARPALFRSHG